MKISIENNPGVKNLESKNNIFMIYGENSSGKTYFINELYRKLKVNKIFIEDSNDYQNYNDIIFIEEELNLKKELEFQKTSQIRKALVKVISEKIEEKNFDLLSKLNNSEELKYILKEIDKELYLESDKFKILSQTNYSNNQDLISELIKLQLYREDSEINEAILSKSEKFQIFLNLFAGIDIKSKIVLLDTPDTGLDEKNLTKLADHIKKLSQNNIVIFTFRNLSIYEKLLSEYNPNFYFIKEKVIYKHYLSKELLLGNYLLKGKSNLNFNLDQEIVQNISLVLDEEFLSLQRDFIRNKFSLFLNNNTNEENTKLDLELLKMI